MSQEELEHLIKYPNNQEALTKALEHQKFLKYHIEGEEKYRDLMLGIMGEVLTKEKFKMFKTLLYPSSKFLYQNIKRDLYALHTADGRVIECSSEEEEKQKLFEVASTSFSGIGFDEFYKNRGWGLLFTEPNAVIITDAMPLEVDELGNYVDSNGNIVTEAQPVNKVVPLTMIHDISIIEGVVNYVIVKKTVKVNDKSYNDYYYYGDSSMAYIRQIGDKTTEFYAMENSLGYCPARTVSNVQRFTDDSIQMASPVSMSISLGNKYIEKSIMFDHSQLNSGYSKTWAIPTDGECEAENCEGGLLRINGVISGECSTCSKNEQSKNLYGAHFTLPDPSLIDGDKTRLFEQPLGQLDADVPLLQWQDDNIKNLENKITLLCTGKVSNEGISGMAKNEMDVQSSYDSYEQTLLFWQKEVEQSYKFHLEAIASYLFDSDVECVVKFGDKLYLKSAEQLESTEKLARENGAPNYILSSLRGEKLRTRYKNNPSMVRRFEVLEAVEPLKEYNHTQLLELAQFIDPIDMVIKVNFSEFIERYEREFNVISPTPETVEQEINNLKIKLQEYGREKKERAKTEEDNGGVIEEAS